jgi:hypothetical protein
MIFPSRSVQMLAAWLLAIGACATTVNAGLIHRYSFNDPTVKDSVGKVNGKLKGAAAIADGKLTLKNEDKTSNDDNLSYVEFDSAILPKSGSVSLVVWFTAKEVPAFARILDVGDVEGGEGRAFIYLTPRDSDDNSRGAITATDAGSKTVVANDRLDDGNEHMVALVVDGKAGTLHVFIDGKEPKPAQDLGDNTLDKVRPAHCWLGRSGFDNDPGLSASIHEFRVYDQALTADEAAAINKAGPGALPPPSTQPAEGK